MTDAAVPRRGGELVLFPASGGFWGPLPAFPTMQNHHPGVCRLFLEDGGRSVASFLLCEGRD